MARKSKDAIIKELQKALATRDIYQNELSNRHSYLSQLIEDGYKNCSTYYLQKEKLDFMTKLYDLNNSLYDSQKRNTERLKARLNAALNQLHQQEIEEYDIGDYQISELRDQNRLLSGKVENRDERIKILFDEISGYQRRISELQQALSRQPVSNETDELKTLILELSNHNNEYRAQLQSLLLTYTALLQRLLQFQNSPTISIEQLNDALKDIIKNRPDLESTATVLQPSQAISDETQMLKDRIAELEKELSQISTEKPQYGRPPKLSPEDTAQIIKLVQDGWSYRKISSTYGYSLGTISRVCKKHKNAILPN